MASGRTNSTPTTKPWIKASLHSLPSSLVFVSTAQKLVLDQESSKRLITGSSLCVHTTRKYKKFAKLNGLTATDDPIFPANIQEINFYILSA